MSNPIFKVIDPRLDLRKPTTYAIEDGARLVNFEVSNTSTAGGGGSSLTWTNADPPGPGVVVDKKVIVAITYRVEAKRTAALDGSDLGQPVLGFEPLPNYAFPTDQIRALGTDGPRYMPIAQTTNVCNVIINNASANGQLFDYIEPLMRYTANRDYDETQLSLAPCQQDQYQDYGDWPNFGAARNVLAAYGENSYQTNRGGHPLIYIQSNPILAVVGTQYTAVAYITSYEPIFVSPCDFGVGNQRGFYGVNTFRVTINTTGDLNRVWCHNANPAKGGWALDSLNVRIVESFDTGVGNSSGYTNKILPQKPQLFFTYLTPKIMEVPPEFNTYPYYYLDDQVFDGVKSVPALSAGFYKTNSFNLDSIPKYLYIFVRETNSNRDYTRTDTYAFINKIDITFANNPNQLANADSIQLYEMSVKNGCKMSWAQWSKFVGSVICVDFSQDISLPDDMFVGMKNANAQLSVRAEWVNLSDREINYSVYVIPSYVGVFDITAGQAQAISGITSLQEYLNAPDVHTLDYVDAHNFYGGSFMSKMRDISRTATRAAVKAAPSIAKYAAPLLAPRFAPEIEKGVDLASELVGQLIGSGYSKQQAMKMIKDGSYMQVIGKPKKKKGGAKMSKQQMNHALLSRAIR